MSKPDANKTPLTIRVTATAAAYLDGAGFKPVETEVPVTDGWIADLASFIYPSRTEAKKLRLVYTRRGKETATSEYQRTERAYNELRFATGPIVTALVEVKVTRPDFTKDLAHKFVTRNPPAHLCYVAYPCGMITPDEIPDGWIGLETTKDGQRIYRRHSSRGFTIIHPQHVGNIAHLIAAVAIRRDHRTRYAAMREYAKATRVNDTDRRKVMTMRSAITGIVQWVNGRGMFANCETVEDVLKMTGWGSASLPKYAYKDIGLIEELRKANIERMGSNGE